LTTDVRPVETGLSALSDLNVTKDDVVSAVRHSRLSFEDQCDVIDMIARPYVLASYTALWTLRRELVQRGYLAPFFRQAAATRGVAR
jgi:hypothetical protein